MPTEGALAEKMVQTVSTGEQKTFTINAPKKEQNKEEEPEVNNDKLEEHIPLRVLINNIGKIVKAMKVNTGSIDEYNTIVEKVTGNKLFRCNTATEQEYDLIEEIYNQLKQLGY